MTQLFLYRAAALISADDIAALREAGLVPVKVDSFEDVRLIDPIMANGQASAVWRAAVEAIAKANDKEGVKTMFGRLLAEKLAAATVFGADGVPLGA